MNHARRTLVVGLLASAMVVPIGSMPAGAGGPPAPGAGAPPVRLTRLIDIAATHHPGFDRVVFEFDRRLPAQREGRYVPSLHREPSGLPLRVPGRAILRVDLRYTDAHSAQGDLVPRRVAYRLPNVLTVVRAQDFEGVVTYGIGLAARRPFTVSTLHSPSRVVVDIGTGFAKTVNRVSFLNRTNFLAGHRPYVTNVSRPVRTANPAVGLMDRLFAGPTVRERHAGLRLVRSHATGFTWLGVRHGVARIQLTGGCDSNGATFTVANEIVPTLRRLATVDVVKIYDPRGSTQSPRGRTDSIPACLEP
ncbi:MAG: hypothetical protein WAN48_14205 [Actinomycetes bacterium]